MKFALSLAIATVVTIGGYSALQGPLSMPAFHDGMAAPKTIATVVARPARTTSQLVGVR